MDNYLGWGPGDAGAARLNDLDAKVTAIPQKSFYADIEAYFGNVKTIDDFQDISGWTAEAGATQSVDTAVVKIGKQSNKLLQPNNTNALISTNKNNITLDLTKLNSGEVSTNDDYISVACYISNVEAIGGAFGIAIMFSSASTFDTANRKKHFQKTGLVTGWNFIKVKKSAFLTDGVCEWNDIKSVRLFWESKDGYQNAYVSFQLIQLVKKDPAADYPNPFQKNGVREFSINAGEWFVGKEFSEVKIKSLNQTSVLNALVGTIRFKNFLATTIVVKNNNSSDYERYFMYYLDNNNHFYVANNGSTLTLYLMTNGVSSSIPIGVLDNTKGDVVRIVVSKIDGSLLINVFQNGMFLYQLKTSTTVDNGYFAFGITSARDIDIKNLSISELQHAHHADMAEVAKCLVEQPICKLWNSVSQSIPNNSATPVVFNTVIKDNRNHFDANNPTRIYCREPGIYAVHGGVRFDANTAGIRFIQIRKNLGEFLAVNSGNALSEGGQNLSVSVLIDMKVGDFLDLMAYQSSGGALNISTNVNYSPSLAIAKIG